MASGRTSLCGSLRRRLAYIALAVTGKTTPMTLMSRLTWSKAGLP
jgi:hypothetical protein